MRNLKYIILIISSLLSVLLIFLYTDEQEDREYAEIVKKEYPKIENFNEFGNCNVKGFVVKADLSPKMYLKGALYVTLNNGNRFRISSRTSNYLYDPPQLFDFLKVNDSISKPAGDNLFLIYRGTERYFFKLGQSINRKE